MIISYKYYVFIIVSFVFLLAGFLALYLEVFNAVMYAGLFGLMNVVKAYDYIEKTRTD